MAPAILPKKMIRSAILIRSHRREPFDEIVEEPPFGVPHVLCVGLELYYRDSALVVQRCMAEGIHLGGFEHEIFTDDVLGIGEIVRVFAMGTGDGHGVGFGFGCWLGIRSAGNRSDGPRGTFASSGRGRIASRGWSICRRLP